MELAPMRIVGEIDSQIATAKNFPRDPDDAMRKLGKMVTASEDAAEMAIFALPRGGKTIEGASVRFAEALMLVWKNARARATTVERAPTYVVARGTFVDVENNVVIERENRRMTVDRHNRPYSEDLRTQSENAAQMIALRNAILTGIPRIAWEPVYEAARKMVAGDASKLADRRAKAMEYLQKLGVTAEMVLAACEVTTVDEITSDHLVSLRATARQIRDGEVKVDDAFPSHGPAADGVTAVGGVEGLKARMAGKSAEGQEARSAESPTDGTGEAAKAAEEPAVTVLRDVPDVMATVDPKPRVTPEEVLSMHRARERGKR